mgnify:CR=1 FL=1
MQAPNSIHARVIIMDGHRRRLRATVVNLVMSTLATALALAGSAGAQNVSVNIVDYSSLSSVTSTVVGVTATSGATCTFSTFAVAVVQNSSATGYNSTVTANTMVIKAKWSLLLATQTAVKPFMRLFKTINWRHRHTL